MPNVKTSTTYDFDKKDNSLSKYESEIGDTKQNDFYPQVKLKQWENETNFSVRLSTDIKDSTHKVVDDVIEWESSDKNIKSRFYELDADNEQFEEGGFEFEVIFTEKPKSNSVLYTIKTKGLRFVKQRALTRAEIDEGHEQPDNAKWSYAVFHNSKMNNEYRTGKAFHIYRPFAVDADGKRVWCEIYIDVIKEEMEIVIPQKFLDNAVYPVILDPTFGYTVAGAAAAPMSLDDAGASPGSPASDGNVSKITFYGQAWAGKYMDVKAVIWDDGTNNVISNGVGGVTRISGGTKAWYDITYSTQPSVVSTSTYMPGYVCSPETNGFSRLSYDFDNPNGRWDTANSYASPTSFTNSNTERKFSSYATYSSGPSGYGNNVNGVESANIGSVNGVATGDISKVSGV